jgi:hypothetical protein
MNPKPHKAKAAAIIASIIPSVLLTINSNIAEHFLLCLATICSISALTVISSTLEILTANTLQETQKLKTQQNKQKTHCKTPPPQFLFLHYNYIRYKASTSKNTTEYLFYRRLGDMLF